MPLVSLCGPLGVALCVIIGASIKGAGQGLPDSCASKAAVESERPSTNPRSTPRIRDPIGDGSAIRVFLHFDIVASSLVRLLACG